MNTAMLDKMDEIFGKIDEWIAMYGVGLCIVFAMLYTSANVVARYVFGDPIKGMHHIVAVAMVPMTYLALGYAWRNRGTFVAATVLFDKSKGKVRCGLEIFFHLVALVFLAGVVGYFSLRRTLWAIQTNDMIGGADFLIVSWPIRATMVLGCLLLSISVITSLLKLLRDRTWLNHEGER